MIRSTSPRLPVFAIALGLAGVPCLAQPAAPAPAATAPGDTIRLTDAQRQAILDSSTEDRAAAARGELTDARPPRGIHGEVGAMIGSNGTRGIYGTAAIPLGENGGAVVSFENSRYGYRR